MQEWKFGVIIEHFRFEVQFSEHTRVSHIAWQLLVFAR